MKINLAGIKNEVKPELTKAGKNLDSAISMLNSITVPRDYYETATLKVITKQTQNIKSEIKTVYKWLNNSINNFNKVESKNKTLLNNLSKKIKVGKINTKKNYKSNSSIKSKIGANKKLYAFIQYAKPLLGNTIRFSSNGSLILDASDLSRRIGAIVCGGEVTADSSASTWFNTGCQKISNTVDSILSWSSDKLDSLLSWGSDKIDSLLSFGQEKVDEAHDWVVNKWNSAVDDIKNVGSKISSGWNSFYEKVLNPIANAFCTGSSSVVNMGISFLKGIASFTENMVDTLYIGLTGVASIPTVLYDVVTSLCSGEGGIELNKTGEMWKGTMSFVANDYVENKYKDFYESTSIGKWLDNHALEQFKSSGSFSQISSGIGYIAGTVISSYFLGASASSMAALAGFGKATRRNMERTKRCIL